MKINILKLFPLLFIMLAFVTQSTYAQDNSQLEKNKQIVVAFYNQVINQKNFIAAQKFLGPRYTQHNPQVADGPAGLKTLIQYLRTNFPKAHSDIKQVLAEGDYVVLHIHSVREPGSRGSAIVDLYKLENNKIVEHWDVIQAIPATSANANSMF